MAPKNHAPRALRRAPPRGHAASEFVVVHVPTGRIERAPVRTDRPSWAGSALCNDIVLPDPLHVSSFQLMFWWGASGVLFVTHLGLVPTLCGGRRVRGSCAVLRGQEIEAGSYKIRLDRATTPRPGSQPRLALPGDPCGEEIIEVQAEDLEKDVEDVAELSADLLEEVHVPSTPPPVPSHLRRRKTVPRARSTRGTSSVRRPPQSRSTPPA